MRISEPLIARSRFFSSALLLFLPVLFSHPRSESQDAFSVNGNNVSAGGFQITFPSIPKVTETFSDIGVSKRIEVTDKESGTYFKCESIPLPNSLSGGLVKEQVIQMLSLRAKADGLELVSVNYEQVDFGHKAVMRGNKTLRSTLVTYEATCFATSDHVFTVLIAGRASSFPSADATAFKRSVKHKGQLVEAP
jgi:hypothetical protein